MNKASDVQLQNLKDGLTFKSEAIEHKQESNMPNLSSAQEVKNELVEMGRIGKTQARVIDIID